MQHDASLVIHVKAYSSGVAVLDDKQRLLMVQEAQSQAKGLWHIPAGSVEQGESFEAAALREAYEETGLSLKLDRLLNTYLGTFPSGDPIVRLVWLASIQENLKLEPVFKEEILECKFISKADFDLLYEQGKIRMAHTKMMFEDALKTVQPKAKK